MAHSMIKSAGISSSSYNLPFSQNLEFDFEIELVHYFVFLSRISPLRRRMIYFFVYNFTQVEMHHKTQFKHNLLTWTALIYCYTYSKQSIHSKDEYSWAVLSLEICEQKIVIVDEWERKGQWQLQITNNFTGKKRSCIIGNPLDTFQWLSMALYVLAEYKSWLYSPCFCNEKRRKEKELNDWVMWFVLYMAIGIQNISQIEINCLDFSNTAFIEKCLYKLCKHINIKWLNSRIFKTY